MECEICGMPIKSQGKKISIERSDLTVCDRCIQFGKEKENFSFAPKTIEKKKPIRRRIAATSLVVDEVIEEYHIVVRAKREEMGLTQEELAKRINEKSSLLGKIERGDILPDDSVIKKLENEFNVKLIEKTRSDEKYDLDVDRKGLTLGDVAFIKKK